MKDRLNGATSHLDCRFLEWSGWYNQDLYQRLLGYYRLYQIFKKEGKGSSELTTPFAYILDYRAMQGVKLFLSRVVNVLYKVGTFGKEYILLRIETLNRVLLFQYPHLLEAFLHDAETDLGAACQKLWRKSVNCIFTLLNHQISTTSYWYDKSRTVIKPAINIL